MHWSFEVGLIFSFSILIAGVIGIFRFNQIRKVYRPFIYLIWLGCITEIVSTYFAYVYHNNLGVGAIYRLCESFFLLWFFSRLGIFQRRKQILYLLIALFLGLWVADTFFQNSFTKNFTFYFDIIYALSVVLLSIRAINDLLFTEKELLKNPTFLICLGLIIFFTYQIIQRLFLLYGLGESRDFRRSVQRILQLINCFTNLIYALAVLWMRKRQPFTFEF